MRDEELHRVIIHADFDSYYCQVEMKRLGIPRETPCAVQQWEGLIAVNYPARDRGVTRHMRVAEARKICPDLVLVHVETIGADGASSSYAGEAAGGGGGRQGQETNRLTQKACLERYRRSTAEVLQLLHRLAPGATIEKASIDEVYMDVTAMVDREVQDREAAPAAAGPADAFGWGSIVVGGPLDPSSELERRLAVGAGIACRLRGALLSEMGYTASAGIAVNKLLAKIGSAKHKPNQQTVIPPRGVQVVMQDLPLDKLGGFGGKLGEALKSMGCITAGQVQALSHATLAARFGEERAGWIEEAVRGISHEPVEEKQRPKSMLAAKSFNATSDLAALERWFGVLAQELAGRMSSDEVQFRRRPKNLVVHFRGGAHPNSERSKTTPMPRFPGGAPSSDVIAAAAFSLFKSRCVPGKLPCSRLAISAADFADLPAAGGNAITRFLVPKAQAAAAAASTGGGAGGRAQPAAATAETQQEQQQQQQQAKPPRQGAAGAGRSIGRLFERALKRQRLEQGDGQQHSQSPPAAAQEQQVQQQPEQPQPQQPQQPAADQAAGAAVDAGGPSVEGLAATAEVPAAPAAVEPPDPSPTSALTAAAPAGAREDAVASAAPIGSAGDIPTSAGAAIAAATVADKPAGATDATADPAGAESAAGEQVLAEVDVEEQRRILKDIHMLQRLTQRSASQAGGSGGGGGSRGGGSRPPGRAGSKPQQAAGGKQQPSIAAFFGKPAPKS